jgi:hypothetical protein
MNKLVSKVSVRLAVASCIAVVGGAAAVATVSAANATVAPKTHFVPGVLGGLSKATLLGSAPAGTRLNIGVAIANPNQAAEAQLQQEMYESSSPEYHHFLSVSQFNARFGVAPATTSAVRHYLTAAGLEISTSSAGGNYFTVSGTVAQLDKLFAIKLGDYEYKNVHFLANNVAPSIPDTLPIDAVLGLNSVQKMTLASLHGKTLRASARPASKGQAGDQQDYTPQELWNIYNDPGATSLPNANSGLTTAAELAKSKFALGQGQIMGIFGEGETSSVVAQLRLFESATGLPKVPVRTIETEGPDDSAYGDNTGAVEWYLDSQSSTGMAPDVKQLDFLFAKSLYDADITKEFDYWAEDPTGPREMNASFGECEENPTNPVTGPLAQYPYGTELGDELEAAAEPMLEQATMEGRTLFTSAGDTGSGCPEVAVPVVGGGNGLLIQPVPLDEFPCASAYAVCVSGTVLSSPGDTYKTGATKVTADTNWTFGSGGTSEFVPAPKWQDGVSHIDHDCLSQPDGVPYPSTTLCRGAPDVADLSGDYDGDGYFIYIDGEPASEGGTSLSSPLMLGQWARIQSAAPAKVQKKGGLGFADPLIYKQAASADTCSAAPCTGTYARDFFNILQSEDVGDEGGFAGAPVSTGITVGNGAYEPGPGWSYTSGWGSINVANFAHDVDGSIFAADRYTGAERAAIDVCKATMYSPVGNATDPVDVSIGNSPGADLTQATLSSPNKQTIAATLTVPRLSAGPSLDEDSGIAFYVAWEFKGLVYYAQAIEASKGSWSFSTGNTGPFEVAGKTQAGRYTDLTTSKATGHVDTATGVITIDVPTIDVGSPKAGSLLIDPQALAQGLTGVSGVDTLALTIDSAANRRAYSVDDGQLDSIGTSVVVAGKGCSKTLPRTSLKTAATGVVK